MTNTLVKWIANPIASLNLWAKQPRNDFNTDRISWVNKHFQDLFQPLLYDSNDGFFDVYKFQSCSLCTLPFVNGSSVGIIFGCQHLFHEECILDNINTQFFYFVRKHYTYISKHETYWSKTSNTIKGIWDGQLHLTSYPEFFDTQGKPLPWDFVCPHSFHFDDTQVNVIDEQKEVERIYKNNSNTYNIDFTTLKSKGTKKRTSLKRKKHSSIKKLPNQSKHRSIQKQARRSKRYSPYSGKFLRYKSVTLDYHFDLLWDSYWETPEYQDFLIQTFGEREEIKEQKDEANPEPGWIYRISHMNPEKVREVIPTEYKDNYQTKLLAKFIEKQSDDPRNWKVDLVLEELHTIVRTGIIIRQGSLVLLPSNPISELVLNKSSKSKFDTIKEDVKTKIIYTPSYPTYFKLNDIVSLKHSDSYFTEGGNKDENTACLVIGKSVNYYDRFNVVCRQDGKSFDTTKKEEWTRLSSAGLAIGGVLGGTSAALATMGIGAPLGAATGAATGAAAGYAFQNYLNTYKMDPIYNVKDTDLVPTLNEKYKINKEVLSDLDILHGAVIEYLFYTQYVSKNPMPQPLRVLFPLDIIHKLCAKKPSRNKEETYTRAQSLYNDTLNERTKRLVEDPQLDYHDAVLKVVGPPLPWLEKTDGDKDPVVVYYQNMFTQEIRGLGEEMKPREISLYEAIDGGYLIDPATYVNILDFMKRNGAIISKVGGAISTLLSNFGILFGSGTVTKDQEGYKRAQQLMGKLKPFTSEPTVIGNQLSYSNALTRASKYTQGISRIASGVSTFAEGVLDFTGNNISGIGSEISRIIQVRDNEFEVYIIGSDKSGISVLRGPDGKFVSKDKRDDYIFMHRNDKVEKGYVFSPSELFYKDQMDDMSLPDRIINKIMDANKAVEGLIQIKQGWDMMDVKYTQFIKDSQNIRTVILMNNEQIPKPKPGDKMTDKQREWWGVDDSERYWGKQLRTELPLRDKSRKEIIIAIHTHGCDHAFPKGKKYRPKDCNPRLITSVQTTGVLHLTLNNGELSEANPQTDEDKTGVNIVNNRVASDLLSGKSVLETTEQLHTLVDNPGIFGSSRTIHPNDKDRQEWYKSAKENGMYKLLNPVKYNRIYSSLFERYHGIYVLYNEDVNKSYIYNWDEEKYRNNFKDDESFSEKFNIRRQQRHNLTYYKPLLDKCREIIAPYFREILLQEIKKWNKDNDLNSIFCKDWKPISDILPNSTQIIEKLTRELEQIRNNCVSSIQTVYKELHSLQREFLKYTSFEPNFSIQFLIPEKMFDLFYKKDGKDYLKRNNINYNAIMAVYDKNKKEIDTNFVVTYHTNIYYNELIKLLKTQGYKNINVIDMGCRGDCEIKERLDISKWIAKYGDLTEEKVDEKNRINAEIYVKENIIGQFKKNFLAAIENNKQIIKATAKANGKDYSEEKYKSDFESRMTTSKNYYDWLKYEKGIDIEDYYKIFNKYNEIPYKDTTFFIKWPSLNTLENKFTTMNDINIGEIYSYYYNLFPGYIPSRDEQNMDLVDSSIKTMQSSSNRVERDSIYAEDELVSI
jgi:hypothetical protein